MAKVHIKKNDLVFVLAGKDRGKTGKVLKVFPPTSRAIVEGINFIQKHTRANPQKNDKGGILPKESSIHLSNLMVVCKHRTGRDVPAELDLPLPAARRSTSLIAPATTSWPAA